MKKILFLLAVIGLCFITSCHEEKNSCPPVYQGFRIDPSTVYAGDSVTITAVQQTKGRYLNATNYTWKLTMKVKDGETESDTVLTDNIHTNYGGLDSSDPTWRVKIPSNAMTGANSFATCFFTANFSNSADGMGGMFNANTADGCIGSINSYSYTLYSTANGTCRFSIRARQ